MSFSIPDKICDDDDIADLLNLIKQLQAERDKYKEALEMAWEILDSIETDLVRTKVKEALGK